MRVMIWGDMEGVACVTSWEQVMGGAVQYQESRVLYTQEINAAARAAKRAGATEIYAVDNHGAGGGFSFKSMVPELLEPGVRWVLGAHWMRYVKPMQEGCDAVLFVGAHAMAGTPDGIMSHTISGQAWYRATVNGVPVGESGIIAAMAGTWDVPAIFVSGDVATCREVAALVGDKVVQAPVKEGFGRFGTVTMTPSEAQKLIDEQVFRALTNRDWPAPYKPEMPVQFRVELATVDQADAFRGKAGIEFVDSRTIVSTGDTFWQVWEQVGID
jgi:D-amino peptidase